MTKTSTDLVIVGTGVAGLYGALCAASEADVELISKGPLLSSASYLAQGGVAAAARPGDSPALHAEDTLRAGRGLSRPSAVRVLTEEAPARIVDLVDLGVDFEDEPGREGGHSVARVFHSGGAATGKEIARVLAERVRAHPRIRVSESERVVGLWTSGGRCVGVVTDRRVVAARATLLATGGAAALWERTTNPAGALGQGVALAYRAGAAVADLEFMQFHPTALSGSSLLLSEALRGAGALLLDDHGERFTDELAPRDVVARAIDARGTALLDLRPDRARRASRGSWRGSRRPATTPARSRSPSRRRPTTRWAAWSPISKGRRRWTVSMPPARSPAPASTAPTASRRTRCSSASSSAVVPLCRRSASRSRPPSKPPQAPAAEAEVTPELRRAFWHDAGLVRDRAGLERLRGSEHLIARLVAESALTREESRGAHFRVDFPEQDSRFEAHVVLRPGQEPVLERWQ